jgi:C2 domain/Domain found in Dishevelled, Egl-10, and Pleckstrin (DEP)
MQQSRTTINRFARSNIDPLPIPSFRDDNSSQVSPSSSRTSPQEDTNNPSCHFHDLRISGTRKEIGVLKLEIIQCFGLPKLDALGETDAYGLAVCGSYAFRTDVVQESANPLWSSTMRRACIFPIFQAYARLFVGIFDADSDADRDDFAGRVVIDLARLRPNSEYDVVLPLRQSAHVYMKRPRGTIRLRLAVDWYSERNAILSYLPETVSFQPEPLTVACRDRKAFQTVAMTVHGTHPPGRFSLKMVKALIREMTFTQIHVLRYLRKRELRHLLTWQYPIISCFVFAAWMHAVYRGTFKYLPGHVLTFLMLHLWKNYAQFVVNDSSGFVQPTWEELFGSLVLGRNCIQGLRLSSSLSPARKLALGLKASDKLHSQPVSTEASLQDIAIALRDGVPMKKRRSRPSFSGRDAVDFLVEEHFAQTREDAVQLGRELAKQLKLFEHIDRKYPFRDERTHYHFLNETPVVSTVRHPWGRSLFRFLGFVRDNPSIDLAKDMPFAPGSEYPRVTVDEGMVHRSVTMMQSMRLTRSDSNDNFETAKCLGLNVGSSGTQDDDDEALHMREDGLFSSDNTDLAMAENFRDHFGKTVKFLKPPPDQNIDIIGKADKPIAFVLSEMRDEVHGYMLNTFNDRAFVVKDSSPVQGRQQSLSPPEHDSTLQKIRENPEGGGAMGHVKSFRKVSATLSNMVPSSPRKRKGISFRKNVVGCDNKKGELEKLLKTGSASSSNPWLSKLGMVLQPMVEIAMAFLSLIRSIYNIFTWRDPMLSFLISFIGPFVILFLHLFPWRLVFGLIGIFVLGPQNWMVRLWRERKGVVSPDNPDKIVSGPTSTSRTVRSCSNKTFVEPEFSHKLEGRSSDFGGELHHVMVPHSQLMYNHRFYDWPPEPQYSRVGAPTPVPVQRTINASVVEDEIAQVDDCFAMFEVTESSDGDDNVTLTYVRNVTQTQRGVTTGQRARALGGGRFHAKTQ